MPACPRLLGALILSPWLAACPPAMASQSHPLVVTEVEEAVVVIVVVVVVEEVLEPRSIKRHCRREGC